MTSHVTETTNSELAFLAPCTKCDFTIYSNFSTISLELFIVYPANITKTKECPPFRNPKTQHIKGCYATPATNVAAKAANFSCTNGSQNTKTQMGF